MIAALPFSQTPFSEADCSEADSSENIFFVILFFKTGFAGPELPWSVSLFVLLPC